MYQSLAVLTGCLVAQAVASTVPLQKRAPAVNDIDILNYALTLEYLERKFYMEGFENYTEQAYMDAGYDAEFYANIVKIYDDEKTHVDFLAGALGDMAIPEPSFAFPSTDVNSFLGLSSVLEGVGVSAYLGAAASIADPGYLTAAGSILTVEARHASYIRAAIGEKPFPKAFDTPLDFNQVFSLAAQFVTGFAPGTKVPFMAFPPLMIAPKEGDTYCAGETVVKFKGAYKNARMDESIEKDTEVFAVFYSGLQTYYVPATRSGCDFLAKVPGANYAMDGQPAPAGQSYVILSTANGDDTKAGDDNTVAGVGIVEVSC